MTLRAAVVARVQHRVLAAAAFAILPSASDDESAPVAGRADS